MWLGPLIILWMNLSRKTRARYEPELRLLWWLFHHSCPVFANQTFEDLFTILNLVVDNTQGVKSIVSLRRIKLNIFHIFYII